ncbi:preprotein translocase subunit SecA [Desulforamulus hydrothermalis]|uniref:Protein translocase subunit SecA n=1 Tax=Desulforamulus hydrothermalis Lam5 = DSM 18033 TaxID=1121428 RepID=K8EG14_9FIRM|nr:preprotein translocase subunit SecA [Desulforamulus hydrothermalis]CCO07631.1 Protein translocase subunit SecA [Desulforamulus hydrothermalis Lam5 = DSM 18033]SHH19504.1 protein translocase subunit secA [Desulforamulus hydrothermalis Lam5 = DSM 18033]
MLGILKNLWDDNARAVKRLQRTVEDINGLEPAMAGLTDEQLAQKTVEFKQKLQQGSSLEDILPQAFAVCREASRRVLNLRHYDVQLLGGLALHQGAVAEMKTGEGKTLAATLPVYLNALTGEGVHVVTVNDYLADRDYRWMAPLYRFLGLSVGLVVQGLPPEQRRRAYGADITYGTHKEFAVDYLRDHLVLQPSQLVQRQLNFALLDEVDCILLDDARTPIGISGGAEQPSDLYYQTDKLVAGLTRDVHYVTDEKSRTVTLTEEGVAYLEEQLGLDNLYDEANINLNHHLNQSLKARYLLQRNVHYVVREGQAVIVDEISGRLLFGRRFSDGLHQALEAKEGLPIRPESRLLATITFQNYFRMYKKLAGMTGTARSEAAELQQVYGLPVVEIPTHKPMIRQDLPDVIYKTEAVKFRQVVEEIANRHQTGQPVLVGTTSIAKSEVISALLKRRGIPHRVLNARHHEQEAEIIAQAGRLRAVTIATNMAGRGVDILLGGNPEVLAQTALRRQQLTGAAAQEAYQALLEQFTGQCEAERQQVVQLGGLHIIGTERHESRRIDDQLRGRAGRQGDPGSSRFFLSLEDNLLRLFAADHVAGLMERLGMEEEAPIESTLVTRAIETAQKRLESQNFNMRKHVLEYDDVLHRQRQVIYRQRRQVLEGAQPADTVRQIIRDVVQRSVEFYCPEGVHPEEWDLAGLLAYANEVYLPGHTLQPGDLEEMGKQGLQDELAERAEEFYRQREAALGSDTLREAERLLMLQLVDKHWLEHLAAMEQLRQGIGLRAYGNKNPLMEYKYETHRMFNHMIANLQEDLLRHLCRLTVSGKQ